MTPLQVAREITKKHVTTKIKILTDACTSFRPIKDEVENVMLRLIRMLQKNGASYQSLDVINLSRQIRQF